MKMSSLKRIIKEAVKEAIQEELKDILLEAVKTPKVITAAPSQPVRVEEQKVTPTQPQMTMEQKREAYKNVLGETDTLNFNSSQAQSFRPNPGMDMSNGQLPAGEVDMTQIMGLMNKK